MMESHCDGTQKPWTVRDARINVAALLNDPRKARRDHDIFTKTWGDQFKEFSSRSASPDIRKVPNVSQSDFIDYLARRSCRLFRYDDQDHGWQPTKRDSRPSHLLFANLNVENADFKSADSGVEESELTENVTAKALRSVPRLFLQSNFTLEDPSIMMSVLNFSERKRVHTIHQNLGETPSKLLQEKLSHCLDSVEVAIVRQISIRSDAFFEAMASHDDLNEYLKKMSLSIGCLKAKIISAGFSMSSKSLQIIHLLAERRRKLLLIERLQTMITVHQAQPTIQLLLSTYEYAGALDLIQTTQEVLKQEMAGLHCFRHLGSQLSVMENVISQMMNAELSQCILLELQRPLEEGSCTVNSHHLKAIALGLLKRKQLIFLDEFREEVKQNIKAIIKRTVIEAVDAAVISESHSNAATCIDECDKGETHDVVKGKTLAERMRLLDFDKWIAMLNEVFANLSVFSRRVRSFLAVIVSVISISIPLKFKDIVPEHPQQDKCNQEKLSSDYETPPPQRLSSKDHEEFSDIDNVLGDMDKYEERLMESVASTTHGDTLSAKVPPVSSFQKNPMDTVQIAAVESDCLLTMAEYHNMMKSVCETLAWTAEFAEDRCVKVIIAKNKNSSLDKLSSAQLLLFAQVIEKYLAETENLFDLNSCNSDSRNLIEIFNALFGKSLKGGVLRGVLQSRASQFINRFHEERKTNLTLILHNETWKQAEVPVELSRMLQTHFSKQTDEAKEAQNEPLASTALCLDGIQFTVAGSVLLLLKMVVEYIRCTDDLAASTPDLTVRVTELLTIFNSRTCQLVLGAGALQVAGLKTISTKNLGLVSRCLQLVLHLLPSIKNHLKEKLTMHCPQCLSNKSQNCLKHFEYVTRAYEDHIAEIDRKLISIMDSVIENSLSKWQVKAPTPSREFRTICRQMLKLHETIDELLPKKQVSLIFEKLHSLFKRRIQAKLKRFDICNDGGPQSGLVTSDLAFYEENLKSLKILPESHISMQSVWS